MTNTSAQPQCQTSAHVHLRRTPSMGNGPNRAADDAARPGPTHRRSVSVNPVPLRPKPERKGKPAHASNRARARGVIGMAGHGRRLTAKEGIRADRSARRDRRLHTCRPPTADRARTLGASHRRALSWRRATTRLHRRQQKNRREPRSPRALHGHLIPVSS